MPPRKRATKTKKAKPAADLFFVGPSEIAYLMAVDEATVRSWHDDGAMPKPASSDPLLWHWSDVHDWGVSTGRLVT